MYLFVLSFSVLNRKHVYFSKSVSIHILFINTYLAVTICDKSGIFSGKLFLNVPAELRENWDRNDLSLRSFRRSVEGTLPLSEDSTSSVKQIRKYSSNMDDCRREIDA